MDILRYLLLAVEVFCSIILIALILMQRSKSEGLGLAFGAGMGETLFGARAGNILTRLTIIFAVVFMANTLALSIMYSGRRAQSLMGRVMPVAPAAAPAQPAAPAGSTAPVAPLSGAPTLPGAEVSASGAAEAPAPEEAPENP